MRKSSDRTNKINLNPFNETKYIITPKTVKLVKI